jgi:ribonuclease Z
MNDADYFRMKLGAVTVEGRSRAGFETWFRIPELGIGLDIGRAPEPTIALHHVFVSHAHLDHAAGIPFWAGQRHLQRMPNGKVYVPSEAADDFRTLLKIHERLEGTEYVVEVVGMAPGDEVRVGRSWIIRAHRATHRVPARAWEVAELRHHIKPEYAGLEPATLAAMRSEGVEITSSSRHPLIFYTGDTDRGILESSDPGTDALFKAQLLMIECSFVMDGDQSRAAAYRHIHFDDIAEFAERFENQHLLLTHFSRRNSPSEIVRELRRRCPANLRDRIRLAFPPPWQTLD